MPSKRLSKVARKRITRMVRVAKWLRRYFLAGLLIVVPIAATILILKWLFGYIDGILGPADEVIFGRHIPGFGFAVIIIVIFLAGLFAANVIGKRAIKYGESMLKVVPIAREIYGTAKQVMESLLLTQTGGFKEVVLVEFPRAGMTTVGFVTNRVKDKAGKEFVAIYIPTTPNPTSGYLEIIPSEDAIHTDMSVEEAVKMVISGGMVSPKRIEMRTSKKEKPGNATAS